MIVLLQRFKYLFIIVALFIAIIIGVFLFVSANTQDKIPQKGVYVYSEID